jgi:hypothetical protein
VDTALEQWLKVVPVVVTAVNTDGTLTVKVQGGALTQSAIPIAGQFFYVNDRAYALWHPGRTQPLVFKTITDGIPSGFLYEATNTFTGTIANATVTTLGAWSRSPSLSGAGTYFSAYSGGVWTFGLGGLYHVNFSASFAANATGRRIVILSKNGTEVRRMVTGAVSGEVMTIEVDHWLQVNAGDTVTTSVYQSSTTSLAMAGGSTAHALQVVRTSD